MFHDCKGSKLDPQSPKEKKLVGTMEHWICWNLRLRVLNRNGRVELFLDDSVSLADFLVTLGVAAYRFMTEVTGSTSPSSSGMAPSSLRTRMRSLCFIFAPPVQVRIYKCDRHQTHAAPFRKAETMPIQILEFLKSYPGRDRRYEANTGQSMVFQATFLTLNRQYIHIWKHYFIIFNFFSGTIP